jgi:hypothetical protein
LKDAPILILDEPTSSLDSISEEIVFDALRRLRAGRTTLVIAHRLSTIRDAARILVLHDGHVVAQGTHDELMESNELYRRMGARLSVGRSLDEPESVDELSRRLVLGSAFREDEPAHGRRPAGLVRLWPEDRLDLGIGREVFYVEDTASIYDLCRMRGPTTCVRHGLHPRRFALRARRSLACQPRRSPRRLTRRCSFCADADLFINLRRRLPVLARRRRFRAVFVDSTRCSRSWRRQERDVHVGPSSGSITCSPAPISARRSDAPGAGFTWYKTGSLSSPLSGDRPPGEIASPS